GRTLPRALIASMIVVIVVYTAANAAYYYVLTPAAVASVSPASSVGLQVLGHVFGSNAQGIATALLFLSVLATLHVSILTNSRITYALAADRDLLPWLSRLNAATHVPGRTVFIGATLAAVLVLLGSFDALSDFQVFSVWVFYSLTALTLFVLRRREPDATRPYHTFGYPFVPAAFVVAAVYLLVETIIGTPLRSLVGLGVIALGVPAYYLLRLRAERRAL
ncbi:MAG TPA: APC family permease, partial [Candidatus Eremiobacteraceae bacterium]|nr:APC family permease [Candidatus Eremiobacteraceae bacterium]